MLYQLLSGVLPFLPGEDSMATLFMHAFEQPTPLAEAAPAVPHPIADVVMRCLATDPVDRFGSAESFGIALARLAADCWGTDWLAPVGIPVIGADTIVAAATGTGRQSSGSKMPAPPATARTVPSGLTAPTVRVRPAQPLPRPRVELADVGRGDVAPVQEVVRFRSPRVPFAIAAVLGLIAIALAVIGLGAPPRGGDLPPRTVTIAGVDPTSADPVEIDMSKPILVTVAGVPGDQVKLALDVLGTSLAGQEAPLVPGGPAPTAAVPAPVNPYVVAGNMTGELRVFGGETPIATYRFGIHTTQPAATTAFAVATVVLALFAAVYVESYIRTLRRGRSRFSGRFGLPLSAAALAVAVVGAVWVLLGREPTVATLVGSAAVAAGAGVAATIGAMCIGRKYRYRRSRRARERAMTPRFTTPGR